MAKEEEASTPACTFSRFEHLLSIEFGTQARMKYLEILEIVTECLFKHFNVVIGHFHFHVDY